MEKFTQEQHSRAWHDGCDAAFDGILHPDFTGMTQDEIDDFNAGYLYMTQHAIMFWCPDPDPV